jgi:hypothetical protein
VLEEKRYKYTVLIIVWSLSLLYTLSFVDRGWVPHDEGALAQSAERVLKGELPHRDFDEIYTGGLTFLHAAAFWALGLNLVSLRIVLAVFFFFFVPALYAIAVRMASPVIAGVVVLLSVVWSVPNYFASVPSWYNLFLATFGTLALIRHVETRQRRWLFIAGVLGGLSFLAKFSGIYYIAAAFLFLTFREQVLSESGMETRIDKSFPFVFVKGLVCLIFVGFFIAIVKSRPGAMEVLEFLVPALSVVLVLLWHESQRSRGSLAVRLVKWVEVLTPFAFGVILPIAIFLIPYVVGDAITELIRGLFVLPQRRLQHASTDLPPLLSVVAGIPYALLVLFPLVSDRSRFLHNKLLQLIVIIALGVALGAAGQFLVYRVAWFSARSLSVMAVLAGCVFLARSFGSCPLPERKRQVLFLLVSMTALLSWVQFPFAAPIYFCYAAPFVILLLLAIVSFQPNAPKLLHAGILGFYLLFAFLWMNTGYIWNLGLGYTRYRPVSVLGLARGGIFVPKTEEALYMQLVDLIRARDGLSDYIYAAPDCPEVYYLSGKRNPTRRIFDFLGESESDSVEIADLLETKRVNVVVINQKPDFSNRLNASMVAFIEERFPRFQDVGKFTVRWKE